MTTTLSHKVCRGCGMNYSPDGEIGSDAWIFSTYCKHECSRRKPVRKLRAPRINKPGQRMPPEYMVWWAMLRRCRKPEYRDYRWYGARGIKVCERWDSYHAFLTDMGRRPSPKHWIERVDNDGDYEPSNCIWLTAEEQAKNRRNTIWVTFRGEEKTLTDWCRQFDIPYYRTLTRLQRGWPPELAISEPAGARLTKSSLGQEGGSWRCGAKSARAA